MNEENFNESHPELLEGEMFLENVSQDCRFEKIRWSTKRLGEIGYDINGTPFNARPVFVKEQELMEAGVLDRVKSAMNMKSVRSTGGV